MSVIYLTNGKHTLKKKSFSLWHWDLLLRICFVDLVFYSYETCCNWKLMKQLWRFSANIHVHIYIYTTIIFAYVTGNMSIEAVSSIGIWPMICDCHCYSYLHNQLHSQYIDNPRYTIYHYWNWVISVQRLMSIGFLFCIAKFDD